MSAWLWRMAFTLLTVSDTRVEVYTFFMIFFMMASLLPCFRGHADSLILYAMMEAGTDLSTFNTAFAFFAVSGAMI